MPASTARSTLPYPVAADPADVPKDVKALADRLDLLLPASGAALPGSPVDGEECTIIADATNGVAWRFKYRAASAAASKWEFVGGAPLSHEVPASETRATASYGGLTTVGPSLTVPLAGDYLISIGANIESSLTAGWRGRMTFSGTDAYSVWSSGYGNPSASPGDGASVARTARTTLAAQSIVCQYKSDAGNAVAFANRWMTILPVRVG
jgi:hypothetical protein